MASGGLEVRPYGHFVLRTPLLELESLHGWPREPEAARQRLSELLVRDEVREAIGIAAPQVLEGIALWLEAPKSERGRKLERALMGYVQRLASRCTPFGLFAGVSMGRIGRRTQLEIEGLERMRRKTRVDLGALSQLCERLMQSPEVRDAVRFRPNETAVVVGDRVHFVTARQQGEERVYELQSVAALEVLTDAFMLCRAGLRLSALRAALGERMPEALPSELEAFVGQLVEQQLLLPELRPVLTGPDALPELLAQLESHQVVAQVVSALQQVRRSLEALDARPIGQGYGAHQDLVGQIERLEVKCERGRALQVDLWKPAATAEISEGLIQGMLSSARLSSSIFPARPSPLASFKAAFERRWESAEVPLLTALDEEAGVGLLSGGVPVSENPLLRDVALGGRPPVTAAGFDPEVDHFLGGVWIQAQTVPGLGVELSSAELEPLGGHGSLPQVFEVIARLFAPKGPSEPLGQLVALRGGALEALNGRFCWLDASLERAVMGALEAQAQSDPERLFAEIVHTPEGRSGNVIARPVLRGYELPLLARSGAPYERQLELSDLTVSLQKGRLVLRSTSLGREVVPSLTNAHNVKLGLPLYRFLAFLGAERCLSSPLWSWGLLEHTPSLPRVTVNRWVVSAAQWTLQGAALREADAPAGLAALADRLRWPRHLLALDFDNALPVDLDNPLSCRAFLDTYRSRDKVVLVEDLQRRYGSLVKSPRGTLANELVFSGRCATVGNTSLPRSDQTVARAFGPGDEWLYAKIGVGVASADRLLVELLAPLLETMKPGIRRWFFVRYADPDHHLRLRFLGEPKFLLQELWPALHESFAYARRSSLVSKEELGTYVREVERYGGPLLIETAEAMFEADSEAVLRLLALAPGSSGLDVRWRWALGAVADLFTAMALTDAERLETLSSWRSSLFEEHGAGQALERSLSKKARNLKGELSRLLSRPKGEGLLERGFEVLEARAAQLHSRARALREAPVDTLTASRPQIAGALMHMTCNRLLRANQRANELVLYDLLLRHFESGPSAARRAPKAILAPS
jgi:thiopeptide-type bacteriocin biosynthesis protein